MIRELLQSHFIPGLLVGIAIMCVVAMLAARAYGKFLQFHACREWREAIKLGGRRYFILPEEEYKHLDGMRNRILSMVPPRSVPRGVPIPGRPDQDLDTFGRPLTPGS